MIIFNYVYNHDLLNIFNHINNHIINHIFNLPYNHAYNHVNNHLSVLLFINHLYLFIKIISINF